MSHVMWHWMSHVARDLTSNESCRTWPWLGAGVDPATPKFAHTCVRYAKSAHMCVGWALMCVSLYIYIYIYKCIYIYINIYSTHMWALTAHHVTSNESCRAWRWLKAGIDPTTPEVTRTNVSSSRDTQMNASYVWASCVAVSCMSELQYVAVSCSILNVSSSHDTQMNASYVWASCVAVSWYEWVATCCSVLVSMTCNIL